MTAIDLDAIKARDAALREGGEAWRCKDCEWCSGCNMLRVCEAHDDDGDVPALLDAVERLRSMLIDAETEAQMQAAEVERLRAENSELRAQLAGQSALVVRKAKEVAEVLAVQNRYSSYRVDL